MSSRLEGLSCKYRKKESNWTSFQISGIPVEILQGSVSQSSVQSFVSGSQCTACAVTAVSLSALKDVSSWNSETIDDIIYLGTQRHEKCDDKDNNGFADVSSFLKFTDIEGYRGHIKLQEELTANGSMDQDLGQVLKIPKATEILSDFMERNWHCVVTLNGYSVGMIKERDLCFLFNSHPCDDTGQLDTEGFGCVIKMPVAGGAKIIESLISSNYGPKKISNRNLNSCVYCIVGLTVELVQAPVSQPMQKPREMKDGAKIPANEKDSGGSEDDFDPRKSKMADRASIAGIPPKFDIDEIPGGFHVYQTAPLPARYEETIPKFFRNLKVNMISTKCVPSDAIQHNLIVMYSAAAMQSATDFYWRQDGYSWVSGSHNELPKKRPQLKVSYHYLRADVNDVAFTRTEISPLASRGGKFDWDELKQHKWPVVLVHYKGDGNLQKVQCMPHGNRKFTPQKKMSKKMTELITNTPTTPEFSRDYKLPPNDPKSSMLRTNLKRKLKFTDTPYQAFTIQRAESDTMDPSMGKLFKPRNVEQVKSVKAQMNKQASFDDPVQLLVHHSILHKELLPIYARANGYLHVLAALPQLDAHFSDLVSAQKKIIFSYDTTFNCGKFYVSILTFRHELLHGSPVLPLRFLFHENKSTFGHDLLFQNLVQSFPLLKKTQVVLVTDREASFKNMRRRHLPGATHIFCHLHIYRNVEEWCKSHNQSSKAKDYCAEIRRLLHSSTLEQFQDLLNDATDAWSAAFLQYFNSRLSEDVQMSSKFAVQDKINFDNRSGVTNNASEAANAAFKQWLSGRKSMYEAVLRSYFYQIAKYTDVKDAFSGLDGKFKVKRDAKVPEFIFESVNDVISDLGLHAIFSEGTYSNNVTRFKPTNIEIKSTAGLAWWYVRNNRITYIDQDSYVKGLDRRTFHVDANRNFCTCLRPSCSHLQAVLIQQRRKEPKTYLKHKLTKASKVYQPLNRAGLKLSDKLRKRARFLIPAERKKELIQKAKSVASKKLLLESQSSTTIELVDKSTSHLMNQSVEVQVLSQSRQLLEEVKRDSVFDDAPAVSSSPVNLCKLSELPTLSAMNAQEAVLKIKNLTVTLQDLKTLDENLKRGEEAAMKKINSSFLRGSLSEPVVDAFFSILGDNKVFVVPSKYTVLAAEKAAPKKLEAAIKYLKSFSWDEINLVMLPFMRSPQLWNLVVVKIKHDSAVTYVMDPRKPMETDEILANNIYNLLAKAYLMIPTKVQCLPPPWSLPQQLTPSCSGVYICLYASYFTQFSMNALMSPFEMRSLILNAICGQCVVKCKHDRIFCFVCGSKDAFEAMVSCDICGQWFHYSCIDTTGETSFSERSFTCGDFKRSR